MAESTLKAERSDSQIVLTGDIGKEFHDGAWSATKIDRGRIILSSAQSGSNMTRAEGFAHCSIDVLRDLLVGFQYRKRTGVISVDIGTCQKKLYFNHGELTFAGSNLMDDRLGEVLYREGMISLDQLTTSAVQVDRSIKFGQVLLRDQIFSNTELWNALKSQVREIFRSVFLVQNVFVEIAAGAPPTEVTFDEGTHLLIENAHSDGAQFRAFCSRLNSGTRVTIAEGERISSIVPGTFLADMVTLARNNQSIDELIQSSKLSDVNTLWVLHRMSCLGYLIFSGLSPLKPAVSDSHFTNLRGKLDALSLLQSMTMKAFIGTQVPFPVVELQKFAWSLNEDNLAAIYVDDSGLLAPECFGNIMSQCQGNTSRVAYFEARIDSLIRYVLQMCGDLLPFEAAKVLRKQYAEISA